MESSKPTVAFFEPSAPPPPLPLLTAHTDMMHSPLATVTILAHEELQHKPEVLPSRQWVLDSYKPNEEGSPQSFASPDSCSSISDNEEGDKIVKPDGEPGRPGRGGYNLEATLGWNPEYYRKMKVKAISLLWFLSDTAFRNV
jgi:hypothetical protein